MEGNVVMFGLFWSTRVANGQFQVLGTVIGGIVMVKGNYGQDAHDTANKSGRISFLPFFSQTHF
jgi:hypothetical protein